MSLASGLSRYVPQNLGPMTFTIGRPACFMGYPTTPTVWGEVIGEPRIVNPK